VTKIYLDVSCLNRPFDDQSQIRVRVEAEATTLILDRLDAGEWRQASSEMATIEIDVIPDRKRRAKVRLLLPPDGDILKLTQAMWDRAAQLETLGFKPADAVHVAAAEEAGAGIFLTCDDRLCRLGRRRKDELRVRVANPVDWLKEIEDAPNA
jgi:predicted nucleic acid-binding protein